MKYVEQLPLILMQALYLHVKDRPGVDLDSVMLKNILGKAHLILILDVHEFLLCFRIIGIDLKLADGGKIGDPLVSDVIGNPVCQKLVSVKQETPLCDPVCLVVELLGEHLVEIAKFLFLKDLCMEPCNTVYGVSGNYRKVSHLDLPVVNDSHLADLLVYIDPGSIAISRLDVLDETAVDLFNYLIYSGKKP